jgi:hypothetical protein
MPNVCGHPSLRSAAFRGPKRDVQRFQLKTSGTVGSVQFDPVLELALLPRIEK